MLPGGGYKHIIRGGILPKRIRIGKKCCEDVKAYLEERISEIESYMDESTQTDYIMTPKSLM